MRKFRCKLHWVGAPWIEVVAPNVDAAMDKAAAKYGWKNYAEMKAVHEGNGSWGPDSGFTVELVREAKK